MYFLVGWPKYLQLYGTPQVKHVFSNRDRSLFGVLSTKSLSIWFVKPCVEMTSYKRSEDAVEKLGMNFLAEWRPDSSMIVVSTTNNHLIFYNVEVDDMLKGLYEQYDSKIAGFQRESAELFASEKIPPISLDVAHEITLPHMITSLVCIRDELMVSSDDGHIWRLLWDGTIIENFSLFLCNVPFCIDQQQTKGSPLNSKDLFLVDIEYSPLIGGFSVVMSDGQASFLTASTLKFQPDNVIGIIAQDVSNATCTAINHRYRLIAYGLKSAQGVVLCFDELTGALQVTHRLTLSAKDFPDVISAAGPVIKMRWAPDGGALAMAWEKGGLSVWSVFGALMMCTLGWDYGIADVMKNVIKIRSLDWGPEGYHLWIVSEKQELSNVTDICGSQEKCGTEVVILQFAKSALTVNAGMSGQEYVFLQAEDRLYISASSHVIHSPSSFMETFDETAVGGHCLDGTQQDEMLVGSKHWVVVPIPYAYLGKNWPVRYTSVDSLAENVVVAGRSGLAHYSLRQKKWRLFGNESQEKDFVVMGGLLWWQDQIILGCFNLPHVQDEIRIYCRENKLDNQFVRIMRMSTQVLQLTSLKDRLLCFCADSHISLFHLQWDNKFPCRTIQLVRILELDISNLVFHPACVISSLMTSLCTQTGPCSHKVDESILLNVCGRLLLLQQDLSFDMPDIANNNKLLPSFGSPTVLASSVENIWVCCHSCKNTPYLTESLWIACGVHGMRVWLPLFPHDDQVHRAHNFMSKRIMLPVNLCIYPLAVVFEDAVIMGAENDTVFFNADSYGKQPFCIISRTSQVYLHHVLRQLLRRNLGYHAWEIAKSCATLPYFPHSLELLLHEVLEEEATSSEPIPDALLPRVIDFIREFPVFLQTVVQCARKTELALWPYLFSAVGNPKSLFQTCLIHGHLDTAASYVIVLQNLEMSTANHQHAMTLLDSALEAGKWQLANELVRFLKAIDPSDADSPPRSMGPPNKFGFPHLTPPVTPTEDDLSFVLGTVALTRGRSHNAAGVSKLSQSPTEIYSRIPHHDIGRVTDSHNHKQRWMCEHKDKSVGEEVFIDAHVTGHARKLLCAGRLRDLGYFSAHLDFHLSTFLKKEKNKAARVADFIKALHTLHQDFQWPYPAQTSRFPLSFVKKMSATSNSEVATKLDHHHAPAVLNDSPGLLKLSETHSQGSICSWEENASAKQNLINVSETVDCHLLTEASRESSMLAFDASETSSLWAEESQVAVDDEIWLNHPFSLDSEAISDDLSFQDLTNSEIQLRYWMHLLFEAGCLEWCLLIAIILHDAPTVFKILNGSQQTDQLGDAKQRLLDGLVVICQWAEKECFGYKALMLSIHNQAMLWSKIGVSSTHPVLRTNQPIYDDACDGESYEDLKSSADSASNEIRYTGTNRMYLKTDGKSAVADLESKKLSECVVC